MISVDWGPVSILQRPGLATPPSGSPAPAHPGGVWRSLFEAPRDPDLERLILDSTVIRAHPRAAGTPKNGTASPAASARPPS